MPMASLAASTLKPVRAPLNRLACCVRACARQRTRTGHPKQQLAVIVHTPM